MLQRFFASSLVPSNPANAQTADSLSRRVLVNGRKGGSTNWGSRLAHPRNLRLSRARQGRNLYFAPPVGMGMSELKMSHWIFQVPFDSFEAFIHLTWSIWEPSAPGISYVPAP